MFGADHWLHNGVQTEGVILESHVTNTITKTRVVIALKFEDGETTEFFQREYQLVEAIQAPKVTKAVATVFFNSAVNHLGQTAPDPGLDVAAAKNELRNSIGAMSEAFSEAVDHFNPDRYGVDESVKQYLREYLATASHFEKLPVSTDTFAWISDQIHIPDSASMDPSYAIFTRLDEELRNAVNRVNSLAAW